MSAVGPSLPASASTVARSVARLTRAFTTPETPSSACSILLTQAAHERPPKDSEWVSTCGENPAWVSAVRTRCSLPPLQSSVTLRLSLARFTWVSSTPATVDTAASMRCTHEAQCMPPTPIVCVSDPDIGAAVRAKASFDMDARSF